MSMSLLLESHIMSMSIITSSKKLKELKESANGIRMKMKISMEDMKTSIKLREVSKVKKNNKKKTIYRVSLNISRIISGIVIKTYQICIC